MVAVKVTDQTIENPGSFDREKGAQVALSGSLLTNHGFEPRNTGSSGLQLRLQILALFPGEVPLSHRRIPFLLQNVDLGDDLLCQFV